MRFPDVFSKLVVLLLCLPLIPVNAQSSVVYLDCNGWEIGSYKNKKGERVTINEPHNMIIGLNESTSRMKVGQKGGKMVTVEALFGSEKITGTLVKGKITFKIDRKTGHYTLALFKHDNKQRTEWSSGIGGICQKKDPTLF